MALIEKRFKCDDDLTRQRIILIYSNGVVFIVVNCIKYCNPKEWAHYQGPPNQRDKHQYRLILYTQTKRNKNKSAQKNYLIKSYHQNIANLPPKCQLSNSNMTLDLSLKIETKSFETVLKTEKGRRGFVDLTNYNLIGAG